VAVELVDDPGQLLGALQQLDDHPRRGGGRGVVAGEHHRDEHPGHLVGAEAQRPVLVPDGHQHVQQVPVLVGGRLAGQAGVHDRLDQADHLDPGLVAAPEALDVRIGVDEGEGVGAPFEVVVQLGEPAGQLVAEPPADQARR
jgi:hypothetical protein